MVVMGQGCRWSEKERRRNRKKVNISTGSLCFKRRDVRFRRNVQEARGIYRVQAIAQGDERSALRQQHKQPIETLKQMGIALGF